MDIIIILGIAFIWWVWSAKKNCHLDKNDFEWSHRYRDGECTRCGREKYDSWGV